MEQVYKFKDFRSREHANEKLAAAIREVALALKLLAEAEHKRRTIRILRMMAGRERRTGANTR